MQLELGSVRGSLDGLAEKLDGSLRVPVGKVDHPGGIQDGGGLGGQLQGLPGMDEGPLRIRLPQQPGEIVPGPQVVRGPDHHRLQGGPRRPVPSGRQVGSGKGEPQPRILRVVVEAFLQGGHRVVVAALIPLRPGQADPPRHVLMTVQGPFIGLLSLGQAAAALRQEAHTGPDVRAVGELLPEPTDPPLRRLHPAGCDQQAGHGQSGPQVIRIPFQSCGQGLQHCLAVAHPGMCPCQEVARIRRVGNQLHHALKGR